MSLEENLHGVKEKLANDQNLLVNAFKLEAFYKKYKALLLIILACIVLFGIYQGIAYYRDHTRLQDSKRLINELSAKNLASEKRKEIEKEMQQVNPELYDFYRYTALQNLSDLEIKKPENLQDLEKLTHSKNPILSALASYQYATFTEDIQKLENFKNDVSQTLQDRAKFQAAYLYMQKGNVAKAHEILDSIQPNEGNQSIYAMAMRLKHYGVTQNFGQKTQPSKNDNAIKPSTDTTKANSNQ